MTASIYLMLKAKLLILNIYLSKAGNMIKGVNMDWIAIKDLKRIFNIIPAHIYSQIKLRYRLHDIEIALIT